jgi:hypothetical protein
MQKRRLFQIVYLLLAALALAQAGCLALVIGGAAGAGAAGYAIYQGGNFYRDYPATLDDTDGTVKTALHELKLPLVNESREGDEIAIESRAGDDGRVSIKLKSLPSRIPADGSSTHITVRVGNLGDEAMSTRILDQISLHLVAPVTLRPPVASSSPPANLTQVNLPTTPSPAVRDSSQPPLAK